MTTLVTVVPGVTYSLKVQEPDWAVTVMMLLVKG